MAKDTKTLIEESKNSFEQDNDSKSLLANILTIVTRVEERMVKLENDFSKIDEIKECINSLTKRTNEMEKTIEGLVTRNTQIEDSCEAMGKFMESVIEKCSENSSEIESLKKRPIEPENLLAFTNWIKSLEENVLDFRCRSMKNNLVFSGLEYQKDESCEDKLRSFLYHELDIKFHVEFGNVHRFGKPGLNGVRPIVARFLYRRQLETVLSNAYRLKGKKFGIDEQLTLEVEKKRKTLYPVMKKAKQEGKRVQLVRDRLYINGQLFQQSNTGERNSEYRDALLDNSRATNNLQSPPVPPRNYKRYRPDDSPEPSRQQSSTNQDVQNTYT